MLKKKIAFVCSLASLVLFLCSCGGGGGGEAAVQQFQTNNESTPAPQPSQQSYQIESLIGGNGRVSGLATNGTDTFFSLNYENEGVWAFRAEGGDPQNLVGRLQKPGGLLVANDHLYWVDNDYGRKKQHLYQSSLDGTQTQRLSEGVYSYYEPATLVADDSAVFWPVYAGSSPPIILQKVWLDGSGTETVYTSTGRIKILAGDQDYIYWLEEVSTGIPDDTSLYRVPKSGGTPQLLSQSLIMPTDLVISGGNVYIGVYGKILKVPVSGGEKVTILSDVYIVPKDIAVLDNEVFWRNQAVQYNPFAIGDVDVAILLDGKGATIIKVPVNGGPITIVAADLKNPMNLLVNGTGIFWTEAISGQTDYNPYRTLMHLPAGGANPGTLTSQIFSQEFTVYGGHLYLAEYIGFSNYSQISRIPIEGGAVETLIGGLNQDLIALAATASQLFIGDGGSLKSVLADGGALYTLAHNGLLDIRQIMVQDGWVFCRSNSFSNGIFKVSAEGGSFVPISANGIGYHGPILSIEEGYVYFLYDPNDPMHFKELRRAPVEGGESELVLSVDEGSEILTADISTTAYVKEWIWNDQYRLLKLDIQTSERTELYSGAFNYLAHNEFDLIIDDWNGSISHVPKNGEAVAKFLSINSPFYHNNNWLQVGSDFVFSVVYHDDQEGYFFEAEYLRRIAN